MVGKTESEKEFCRSCHIWLAPYERKIHVGKYKYHPECYKKRGNGNFNFFKFIKNGAKFTNAPS